MDDTWSKALENTRRSVDRKRDLLRFANWENVLNAFGNFLAQDNHLAGFEDRDAIFGRVSTRHHIIPAAVRKLEIEDLLMLLCDDWYTFLGLSSHDDAAKAAIAEMCPLKTTPPAF